MDAKLFALAKGKRLGRPEAAEIGDIRYGMGYYPVPV
jgi:hypothetical protein